MNKENIIIRLFSEEKISIYKKQNSDYKTVLNLYNWNIKLSEVLYTPLNYFEIVLRNACNHSVSKEIGKCWYLNDKLMPLEQRAKYSVDLKDQVKAS